MANFAKNMFVIAVTVATVATFGLGFVAPQVAMAADAGSLVKGPNSDAVYYIGDNSTKFVFPDAKTYFSWYSDFSGVELLTVAELDTYADGGSVLYRAGTKMITHPNTAKVYVVETNGAIRWIASEEVAAGLFGADWASRVNDISEVFFPFYSAGADLTSATDVPNGSLVMMDGSDTIYLIDGTTKRPFASMDVLTANGYDADYVLTVSDLSAFSDGTSIGAAESSLMDVSQGGSVGVPPAELDGGLTVALASDTPASMTLVANSDGVLMTKATFTATDGDVVVTGMSLKRTDLGSSSDFGYVWLVVDGQRRGSRKSINSADEASLLFSSDSKKVTIPSGTSKDFEIWASTGAATAGDLNAIRIVSVTTDSSVSGLPVTGNTMSMSGVEAPDVTYDDVSVGTTINIGDTQAELAKIKITNSEANEDAVVRGMVFQSDSPASGTRIGVDDITNYTLYDNAGNVVAGPVSMSADNYVRFTFDSPFTILKGGSRNETFILKGDVVAGPSYIATFDIEYAHDLDIIGGTNGYSTDNTSSTWATTEVTVGNAALSVNVDTANNPMTRTITDDTDAVLLLAGNLRADQGNVTVSGFRVDLTGNDMDDAEFVNLKFYVNGVLIGEDSTVDFDANDTAQNFSFTEEFSVTGTVPFEVKIDAESAIDADDWIRVAVGGANMTATRDSDSASITPSGTATGNKVTFGAASVKVTGSVSAPSVTRVKGSAGVIFGAFDVTVGTSSDVTLKSIKLNYGADDGTTAQTPDQNDLQNIKLLKSDMTTWAGPENLNSSEQYTFSGLNKALTAGSTMRFYVQADIASTINDTDITRQWLEIIEVLADDANSDAISVTDDGSTTIAAANEVNDDGASTRISVVTSGTLTVELSPSTPDSFQVVAGSEGVETTEYKLRAEYEDVNITKILATAVAGSSNDDEIAKVYMYADGALLAETGSIVSGVATFNFATGDFIVPAGTTVVLKFAVDLNTSNDALADTSATVQFGIDDFNGDIDAQGATATIYPSVYSSTGTGVTLTVVSATNAATIASGLASSATATSAVVSDATGFVVGDLLLVESEYMLVTAVSGTTLTVERGAAGSTAATHADATDGDLYEQKILGNTAVVYANYPVISVPTQPAGGTLNVGTYEVLKFTVDPITGFEEDIRLEELKVKIDSVGMSATTGWIISDAYLYNGTKLVDSITTDLTASGDLTFDAMDSDADGIVTGPTTFTVKVTVALGSTPGTIDQYDFMRASIDDFGSANAAGSITGGDFDWIDMEDLTADIEWVDTSITEILGPTFDKA